MTPVIWPGRASASPKEADKVPLRGLPGRCFRDPPSPDVIKQVTGVLVNEPKPAILPTEMMMMMMWLGPVFA